MKDQKIVTWTDTTPISGRFKWGETKTCQKCKAEIPPDGDRFIYMRRNEEIVTIHLCADCAEKALVVLADALELPA